MNKNIDRETELCLDRLWPYRVEFEMNGFWTIRTYFATIEQAKEECDWLTLAAGYDAARVVLLFEVLYTA